MSGQIKLKLRCANREIEIEGARSDVETLLSQHWTPLLDMKQDGDNGMADLGGADAGDHTSVMKRNRRSASGGNGKTVSKSSDLDCAHIANGLKQHARFSEIEGKAFNKGTNWEKIAAVLWATDLPLTSGDIAKIFHDLRLKVSRPRVSEALSRNRRLLITEKVQRGASTVDAYRLTRSAAAGFSEWLNSDKDAFIADDKAGNASDPAHSVGDKDEADQ